MPVKFHEICGVTSGSVPDYHKLYGQSGPNCSGINFQVFSELCVMIEYVVNNRNINIAAIIAYQGLIFKLNNLFNQILMRLLMLLDIRVTNNSHDRFFDCKVNPKEFMEANKNVMNEVPAIF